MLNGKSTKFEIRGVFFNTCHLLDNISRGLTCTGYAFQYFRLFQFELFCEYIKFMLKLILSKMVKMDIRCKLLNVQLNICVSFMGKRAHCF